LAKRRLARNADRGAADAGIAVTAHRAGNARLPGRYHRPPDLLRVRPRDETDRGIDRKKDAALRQRRDLAKDIFLGLPISERREPYHEQSSIIVCGRNVPKLFGRPATQPVFGTEL
jgi:hypothetical protein